MKDIDELDALHAAATAGEWHAYHYEGYGWRLDAAVKVGIATGEWREADADFIAAAKNAWPAFSARLRAAEAEVERLRGEVASLALLVNPHAARDAAATERENRAARAILAPRDGEGLVTAAESAMAMAELYKAMWRAALEAP